MSSIYGTRFDGPSALRSLASGQTMRLGSTNAKVDDAGTITGTTIIEATTLSPTSAATAGVTGQIAWDATNIYVCVAGGTAGNATWMKAALTSV